MTRLGFTVCLIAASAGYSYAAEQSMMIQYKKPLTAAAQRCLSKTLKSDDWRYTPRLHQHIMSVAVFAKIELDGARLQHYLFVIDDFSFCGTAGCSMMIAEAGEDGLCHEIYSGSGFVDATEVLAKRDHGYRRLSTPCELRFDGRQYQQIHNACPNINIQR